MPWRTPALDELEALSTELERLRQVLATADDVAIDDSLWDVELGLRHVARRAEARADDVRRVIDHRAHGIRSRAS